MLWLEHGKMQSLEKCIRFTHTLREAYTIAQKEAKIKHLHIDPSALEGDS
jgi:hypothetical protein